MKAEGSAVVRTLTDWEARGGGWHLARLSNEEAHVVLDTATGQPGDHVRCRAPQVIAYVTARTAYDLFASGTRGEDAPSASGA